ncbi:hypothetical protein HC891_06405, partial [Candidatus Gracilibacteria bacterium]|nr:hypothetical protein [Candidatus Gracilibacteria bacterium]
MRIPPVICALIVLITLIPVPARAAARQADERWHSFTTANGLAGNIVQAIWQSPSGALWFGTENGVSRYDGTAWASYRTADGLLDANVWAISGDAASVWFATSSGLSRLDAIGWRSFTVADGLPGNDVRAVLVDTSGNVWAGTFGQGIAVLRPGAERWQSLAAWPGAFVQAIWQARSGDVWFGTNGLGALRLRAGRVEQFSFRERNRNTVWSIGETARGDVWLASFQGLVQVRDDTSVVLADERVDGVDLAAVEALAVVGDTTGDLWFATRAQGLLRRSATGWQRIRSGAGLTHDYVQTIFVDRSDRLWFGTRGGGVSMRDARPLQVAALRPAISVVNVSDGVTVRRDGQVFEAVQNDLRFHFALAVPWLPPHEVAFRYWLTSTGTASDAQLVRSAAQAPAQAASEVAVDLPPASYTLHVQALVADTPAA